MYKYLYSANPLIAPIILAIISKYSKYLPGKKQYCINSIKIPYIELNSTAVITELPDNRISFFRFPQSTAPVKMPYTTKCPNLSNAIKSKKDSGRLIPAFAERANITRDHINAGV